VRAKRFMRLFELGAGRTDVNSPFPPYLFLSEMLPDEPSGTVEAWMDRYGRSFDQLTPRTPARAPTHTPAFEAACARAERALRDGAGVPDWQIEASAFLCAPRKPGMTVVFERFDRASRVVLLLEPRSESGASYARSRDFDISYLKEWNGRTCEFDRALLAWCVKSIERAEASPPAA
jgi:hypothetical protein